MPPLPSSGLWLYNKQTENVPRHWNLIPYIAKLPWPLPATTLPKSTRAQLVVKMQQVAFPTDNLGAATLPKGMKNC